MQIPGLQSSAGVTGVAGSALEKTGKALQRILERLSTAKRINRASDDAAGLSIAEQLTTQIRGFKMAGQNVSDVMAALDIADSATGQVADMLQRQRELALQASNGTLTDDQRQMLDIEYQALNQEIDRTAASAQYNRQGVANGEGLASGNAQAQVGPNEGDVLTMPDIIISTERLGTAGSSLSTSAGAQAALGVADAALNLVNETRSQLGSTVNRLESTLSNLSVSMNNSQAAESVLRDQDMAQGVAELTRAQLLQEGGIKAFSRYREIAANHLYTLLQ